MTTTSTGTTWVALTTQAPPPPAGAAAPTAPPAPAATGVQLLMAGPCPEGGGDGGGGMVLHPVGQAATSEAVAALAFSPDGAFLWAAGGSGSVWVWHVPLGAGSAAAELAPALALEGDSTSGTHQPHTRFPGRRLPCAAKPPCHAILGCAPLMLGLSPPPPPTQLRCCHPAACTLQCPWGGAGARVTHSHRINPPPGDPQGRRRAAAPTGVLRCTGRWRGQGPRGG